MSNDPESFTRVPYLPEEFNKPVLSIWENAVDWSEIAKMEAMLTASDKDDIDARRKKMIPTSEYKLNDESVKKINTYFFQAEPNKSTEPFDVLEILSRVIVKIKNFRSDYPKVFNLVSLYEPLKSNLEKLNF